MAVVRWIWAPVVGLLLVVGALFVAQQRVISVAGIGGGVLVGVPAGEGQIPNELLLILSSPWAIVLIAVGVALIAGWVGYVIGRRRVAKASS